MTITLPVERAMKSYVIFLVFGPLVLICTLGPAKAADEAVVIAMVEEQGSSAYYVDVRLENMDVMPFLVDTGASYTVINDATLAAMKERGLASFVKDLQGTMADDTRKIVPVYRLAQLSVGNKCTIHNVEVAVFSGNVRQILGLSALKKTAPFVFATLPPTLTLQNCGNREVAVMQPR
jgi:predicted aspartyl protease